jgi:hypothetical protein
MGWGTIFYNIFIDTSALPIGINSKQNKIPKEFTLHQNYPNPFNSATSIKIDIAKSCLIILKVYDISGREIKTLINENRNGGSYIINFDASEFASGVYFYRIEAGDFTDTKKMLFVK